MKKVLQIDVTFEFDRAQQVCLITLNTSAAVFS